MDPFSGVLDYFETGDSRTTKNSSDKNKEQLRRTIPVSIGLVCGCSGTAAAAAAAAPTKYE